MTERQYWRVCGRGPGLWSSLRHHRLDLRSFCLWLLEQHRFGTSEASLEHTDDISEANPKPVFALLLKYSCSKLCKDYQLSLENNSQSPKWLCAPQTDCAHRGCRRHEINAGSAILSAEADEMITSQHRFILWMAIRKTAEHSCEVFCHRMGFLSSRIPWVLHRQINYAIKTNTLGRHWEKKIAVVIQ